MPIFTSERVSEHLTRILTPCGVCVYLARGRRRAALLDTGFGFGDLKGYVESLIDTPYVVLLSHGHLDHAGGASQFEEAYLNERDWELAKWHCTLERRLDDVRSGPGGMPEGVTDADFLPDRTALPFSGTPAASTRFCCSRTAPPSKPTGRGCAICGNTPAGSTPCCETTAVTGPPSRFWRTASSCAGRSWPARFAFFRAGGFSKS